MKKLVLDIGGTPKCGKSTAIARAQYASWGGGVKVVALDQIAGGRAPEWLRMHKPSYNVYSYARSLACVLDALAAADVVLADRGPYDATVWMDFLGETERARHYRSELGEIAHALDISWRPMIFTLDGVDTEARIAETSICTARTKWTTESFVDQLKAHYIAHARREGVLLFHGFRVKQIGRAIATEAGVILDDLV